MSEEIAQSNGLLVELARVRRDRDLLLSALHQVEAALATSRADVAQLRATALAYVTAATYEERARLRAELHVLATVEHPGVLLLKELEAARKVVACWYHQPPYYDDCDPGQNDPYHAWIVEMIEHVTAYDAIVKGGGE